MQGLPESRDFAWKLLTVRPARCVLFGSVAIRVTATLTRTVARPSVARKTDAYNDRKVRLGSSLSDASQILDFITSVVFPPVSAMASAAHCSTQTEMATSMCILAVTTHYPWAQKIDRPASTAMKAARAN